MSKGVKDYFNLFQLKSEKYHLKWKINGFKDIPFMSDHSVTSSTFAFGEQDEASWQIMFSKEMRTKMNETRQTGCKKLKLEVSDKNQERAIGFRLTKVDGSTLWETVAFHVELKARDLVAKTPEIWESGNSYMESQIFTFIFESDIQGDIFNEDVVTIEAFIVYKYIDPNPLVMADLEKQKYFSEGFARLYKSKKHADVILKAGDAEILAHKSVLCARAAPYRFDLHVLEDPEHTKQILELDLDVSVAKAMLFFIYCGGLPSECSLSKYPALYAAAEKYQVKGLTDLIIEQVQEAVEKEICGHCLGLEDAENIVTVFLSCGEEKIKAASDKCSHKL